MRTIRKMLMALAAGGVLGVSAGAQEATAPAPPQGPAHNNVKKAIRWKTFQYKCERGATVTVSLADTTAKVLYDNKEYLMKQTISADGNRYSDGQLVWWGKGDGGFLQEDSPAGNGKMLVKDCKLERPAEVFGGTITGTVSYRQRMALPPEAKIHVQLLDMSVWEMPPPVIAEETFTVGNRQVPVAFELKVDPAKMDRRHTYALRARIVVGYDIWFLSELPSVVPLRDNAAPHVDLMLMQMEK
jgi:uncharacterized lipoprotein YbaY/membrane-bound inhibitor of C-type lysozyme